MEKRETWVSMHGDIKAARGVAALISPHITQIPIVVPTSMGHVQFEWDRDSKILEIEVESPNQIHYLKWNPPSNPEEDVISVDDSGALENLAVWYTGVAHQGA